MNCAHCDEEVKNGEPIMAFSNGDVVMHRNCGLRGICGSVAHVLGKCSCFVPGSQESDPPGLTKRQAAELAVAIWQIRQSFEEAERRISAAERASRN